MFGILPDLTPRDSHSLWYTSSRGPLIPSYLDHCAHLIPATGGGGGQPPDLPPRNPNGTTSNPNHPSSPQANIERSFLGRLRAEEAYIRRRRLNIASIGATWIKPPGQPKTLFQMREERREAEEHAEAMRREALAQELAAAAAEEEEEEDMMDEGEEEGEGGGGRDLDEEIPDADAGFGFDGASDEEEEEEEEEESEEEEETEEGESSSEEEEGDISLTEARRERREMANRMASIRATEERMREMIAAQQQQHQQVGHGVGEEEEIDEESHLNPGGGSNMLEEEDLINFHQGDEVEGGEDMDMDADLDDDVPEGGDLSGFNESGVGYEHTDSEVSLSSDEGINHRHNQSHMSYASRRSSGVHQYQRRRSGNLMRGNNPRSSLDISGFLSVDGSSNIGSSPQVDRRTSRFG
ncbi:Apc15p protein-domain-containing protein [Cladorrhinum sp. PSN332]|nr:Apc15p protein-domain-containing protein [Cladorrhinum sp. PSN332]